MSRAYKQNKTIHLPVIAMADETMSTVAVESQIEKVTEESSDVSVSVQNETDAQTSVEATVADTSLGSAAVVLAGYSCYLYQNPESSGVKRQNTEESIALAYIDALVSSEKTMEDRIWESSFEEEDLAAGTVSFFDNAESKAESAAAYSVF